MLRTFYGEDERYVETYWSRFGPRVYFTGDGAKTDADGYFWLLGRVDDVINVAGHRISTTEVESALVSHPAVAEAAVIGAHDPLKGEGIAAFVITIGGVHGDELREELSGTSPRDRQDRAAVAAALHARPAKDAQRQDHAPPAQGHRRGPRARRRDDAARPGDRAGRSSTSADEQLGRTPG